MPPRGRRPPARPRAVLYQRQSLHNEESISLGVQVAANRRHAAARGYDVVAELEDDGISGRKWANRPGVVEAVRMVTDREADIIVVWKWSRFSRGRVDLAVGFDRVESAGGRVESSTEDVDTRTSSGRLQRGMLSEFAAFESERIGETWMEAHAARRERGLPGTGGDRYGYRREWTDAVPRGYWAYTIDEGDPAAPSRLPRWSMTDHDEMTGAAAWFPDPWPPQLEQPARESPAAALRLAYQWVIEGWGANRIVRELNARGYRNRIGQPFKRHGLYDLLDSGFAAGLVVHRQRGPSGQPVGDPQYRPGAHTPIITGDTWDAYLAARRVRATLSPATIGSRHPLSGLLRCGDCGAHMTTYSTPGPDRRGTKPTYACNQWRRLGSEWVRYVGTTRPRAERIVREWLEQHAAAVESAAEADRKTRARVRRARTDAEQARARVDEVNGQLAELVMAKVRREIPEAAYNQAAAELNAELARAESAADEAEALSIARPTESRSLAGRLARAWPIAPAEDLRAGLAGLLRGVWVFPPEARGEGSRVVVVPLWEDPPVVTPRPLPPDPAPQPDDGRR